MMTFLFVSIFILDHRLDHDHKHWHGHSLIVCLIYREMLFLPAHTTYWILDMWGGSDEIGSDQ